MQIKSIYRGARISAFKAREVTREIQGLPVAAALDIVAFSSKKAAAMVAKTLKSAIANAENNNNLRADKLVVQEATVGEGPTFKRFQPKARGSAGPIRKRTSHIRIIVTDEIEIQTRLHRASREGKKEGRQIGDRAARVAKSRRTGGKAAATRASKTAPAVSPEE